jgi:hypothetical protein
MEPIPWIVHAGVQEGQPESMLAIMLGTLQCGDRGLSLVSQGRSHPSGRPKHKS